MSKTIIFFGSGPVAAKALQKLAVDFNIEAVITKPRPTHHKYPFPVLEVTEKLNLKTLTPRNKAELKQLFKDNPFKSQVGVVLDYGIIIPEEVINYFPLGIVNSHFSLLPRYRGADPITFAVLSGDNISGISLMLIVPALDEGPLLIQEAIELPEDINSIQLTDRLIELSHVLLSETLPKYLSGEIKAVPQSAEGISYSRKLTKADGILDFQKPAVELERQIRAFIEWPRSRTELNGVNVVITKAHISTQSGTPGQPYQNGKELGIFTSEGVLMIDQLIPDGKKEMSAAAFLAGHRL